MKQGKNHRNLLLLLTLALAFTACSLGQAHKNATGNSDRTANKNATKSGGAESQSESGQTTSGRDAPACRLLSLSELEAQFGGKARLIVGTDDGEGNSGCTAQVNGYGLLFQIDPPGPGVPATVDDALNGPRMITNESKGQMGLDEPKNFGNIGCYSARLIPNPGGLKQAQPVAPTPGPSTTCLQIKDGLVLLTIWSAKDPNEKISFDVVKGLVEKAAARRK